MAIKKKRVSKPKTRRASKKPKKRASKAKSRTSLMFGPWSYHLVKHLPFTSAERERWNSGEPAFAERSSLVLKYAGHRAAVDLETAWEEWKKIYAPAKRGSKRKRTSRGPVAIIPKPASPPPSKHTVDFDDEDAVLAEMATALDIPADQLSIRETSAPAGVGNSKSYQIEITGGTKEWFVVENDDAAEELAIAAVTQDLENEPEIFNQSFIESHIDTERLRRELHGDVLNMNEETLRERSAREFWSEAEDYGVTPKYVATGNDADGRDIALGTFDDESDADEAAGKWLDEKKESDPENADGYGTDVEAAEPDDSDIEKVAEAQTEAQLKDPMSYLEDIYGKEDVVKQAIRIAGIDVNAAAQEAVNTDGPGHFLSSYDGELHETKHGLAYWRHS